MFCKQEAEILQAFMIASIELRNRFSRQVIIAVQIAVLSFLCYSIAK